MTATLTDTREPTFTLPTGRLLVTVCAVAAAAAAAWTFVTALLGPPDTIAAGFAGATVVAVVTIGSVLAIRPWKRRPVSAWTTLWLAALIGRLVLTPAIAYLLYSATPLGLMPLMLSVAVAYVVVQISEAAALASSLKRIV